MILDRLKEYIDYKGISISAFEKSIGMSNASFGKSLKSKGAIGTDKLENILKTYPDISPLWLVSGIGDMLTNQANPKHTCALQQTNDPNKGIPLIPIDAMAGFFQGEQSVMLHECDFYVIPIFKNADFLITVRGDSMQPKYYSGDIIACKHLPLSDIFFQWGKVYVIDTDQGALIKKVEPGNGNDTITLVSENPTYKPFEVAKKSIYHISLVLGVIRTE